MSFIFKISIFRLITVIVAAVALAASSGCSHNIQSHARLAFEDYEIRGCNSNAPLGDPSYCPPFPPVIDDDPRRCTKNATYRPCDKWLEYSTSMQIIFEQGQIYDESLHMRSGYFTKIKITGTQTGALVEVVLCSTFVRGTMPDSQTAKRYEKQLEKREEYREKHEDSSGYAWKMELDKKEWMDLILRLCDTNLDVWGCKGYYKGNLQHPPRYKRVVKVYADKNITLVNHYAINTHGYQDVFYYNLLYKIEGVRERRHNAEKGKE
jgi:hypothetical protein